MIELLIHIRVVLVNLAHSIESVLKILFLSKFDNQLKHVRQNNTKLLILANGPSLSRFLSSAENFENYDLLTVNFFPLSDNFITIKPRFHCIAAPELWRDGVKQIYIDMSNQLFGKMAVTVSWHMYLFIPFEARKYSRWQEPIHQNKSITVVYFNNTPIEGLKSLRHFLIDKGFGMPRPHNVLIPALIISIQLRFKEIYLAGVDHSWLGEVSVNENNEAMVCQKHFYDSDTAISRPMNYRGIRHRRLYEILHKFYLTFKSYFEIEDYAKSRNVKIFNSTENSFIDAFKRKKIH
tara:strand:- start:180 stop:1058 length:879 start_codon:yes stop_codon:yes gene_type:complete